MSTTRAGCGMTCIFGCGVANETDEECNPLNDELMAPNTAARAYADLWFYSNPVFVRLAR